MGRAGKPPARCRQARVYKASHFTAKCHIDDRWAVDRT